MDKKPLLEFIGNIISISSFIEDIKIKMMFLFDELKILQIKKNQITHYYAIEKNLTTITSMHTFYLIVQRICSL